MTTHTVWKRCSVCKKDILLGAQYFLCSVSTCRHSRTGLKFCSMECWDAHLGNAKHRSAYAEEETAPLTPEPIRSTSAIPAASKPTPTPQRRIVNSPPAITAGVGASAYAQKTKSLPKTDTLVVVSKVKQLISEQSEFNTSQCCIDALTEKVVKECLNAIEKAKAAGRKTVMGRDIN